MLLGAVISCALGPSVALGASGAASRRQATPPSSTSALSVQIQLRHLLRTQNRAVAIQGQAFLITGLLRPYAPGQVLHVRVLRGHRLLKGMKVRLRRSGHGPSGQFSVGLSSRATGTVTVEVLHRTTSRMDGFVFRRRLEVVGDRASFGSRSPLVKLIQRRLAALHIYLRQTGVYDTGMGLALDAYHRLLGWGTSHSLDQRTIKALLRGEGRFPVRFPGHGRHAEADLSKQLLALVDGRRVLSIFPTSSGKPSTPTILGNFRIYSRVRGYLPDGMYYSDFFHGNYAIHGYNPAPDYPASHGCIRVPIADAIHIYDWLALGDWVDVYQ